MKRSIVTTDKAPAAIGPYSQGVVCGGMIFASGQIPLDPRTGALVEGGIEAQTRRVLANLEAVLAESGASLKAAAQVTVYLASLDDFAAVNAIYSDFIDPAAPPARVTIEAAGLPRGALVEISAIAPAAEA